MKSNTRNLLLSGASILALSIGGAGIANAQLVTFGSGTISAPDATSGVAIGLLASQINNALTGSALVTNGSGVTLAPGAGGAVDATTAVNSNALTATIAGNLAAPAVGESYTVNLPGMSADGTGVAATTVFQLNTAPNVLAGVGVDAAGVATGTAQTIGSTFVTSLTSSASVAGNVIGSTALGNQTVNVAGGTTPGAGVAGGSASVGLTGELVQRTNTLVYDAASITDTSAAAKALTTAGATTMPSGSPTTTAGTLIYVTVPSDGTSNPTYYTSTASAPTPGTYAASSDPGGTVNGVIAATTLQRNTGLGATDQIRAITDSAGVVADLVAGAASATLDVSLNTVSSAATGNSGTTGIAVTGGAPTLAGGLVVVSEQVNSTDGTATGSQGISALTNAGAVQTTIAEGIAGTSVLMDGNRVTAAAVGSSATNTLTISGMVRAEGAAVPAIGNGEGNLSTGAVLAQEVTQYSQTVAGTTVLGTSAATTDATQSSGVAPNYQATAAVADYLAVNVQRNTGTATDALTISGSVTGSTVNLGVAGPVAGGHATTGSTLALTGSTISGSAVGSTASTTIGNGTATLLGDAATLAALNLQEATNTSVLGSVTGSNTTIGLTTTGFNGVITGGSVTSALNATTASAVSNVGTVGLSNIAASGGTLAADSTFTVGVRADATENLDASYVAPLAAVSAQRITTTSADPNALVIAGSTVNASDTTISFLQNFNNAQYTAAVGSTVALEGNRVQATAGGNQSTVGVSFAEGSGSLLPGGALAATAQIIAPDVTGTSISAAITASDMQISAIGNDGATPAVLTASVFDGGSVSASTNRFVAQAIANQGSASISGTSMLLAGGAGGTGATATLPGYLVGADPTATPAVAAVDTDASASYLVSSVQRVVPTTGTMAISASSADSTISIIGGGRNTSVAVDSNLVSAVGAANVFSGGLDSLLSTGAATQLATSLQDVAGTSVSSSVADAAAVFSSGNSALGYDATTVAAGVTSGSLSVAGNTFRAMTLMNESTLTASGAGVVDLGSTGSGRTVLASLTQGAPTGLSVSGMEVGLVNQQTVSLDNTGTTAVPVGAFASASNTNALIGVFGEGTLATTTVSVAGNTVDARTTGSSASLAASGEVFAGGVGVVNSQSMSQNVANLGLGLNASNTGAYVGVNTGAAAAIDSSTVAVSSNTVSASTAANDAQLQVASFTPGSLGNAASVPLAGVSLATGTGGAFLNAVSADYLAGNVQSTSNLRAGASVGSATIAVDAPVSGGSVVLASNRITADLVGNRATANQSLPSVLNASVQTASTQSNVGGTFNSSVTGASLLFNGAAPSVSDRSTLALNGNAISASTMGNVFNSRQSATSSAGGYMQTASYQVNNGTSIGAAVSGATVAATANGGLSTTTMSGNTIGASAMGNVLRATVGAR